MRTYALMENKIVLFKFYCAFVCLSLSFVSLKVTMPMDQCRFGTLSFIYKEYIYI